MTSLQTAGIPMHQLEDMEIMDSREEEAVRVEPSPRWVRAFFLGKLIADSKQVLLVFEPRRLPTYYFPTSDVRMDLLLPSDYSAARVVLSSSSTASTTTPGLS